MPTWQWIGLVGASAILAAAPPPAPESAPQSGPESTPAPYGLQSNEAWRCLPAMQQAGTDKSEASVHPLGDEPNAQAILTVYRSVDGCPAPIIIRRDIGPRR